MQLIHKFKMRDLKSATEIIGATRLSHSQDKTELCTYQILIHIIKKPNYVISSKHCCFIPTEIQTHVQLT